MKLFFILQSNKLITLFSVFGIQVYCLTPNALAAGWLVKYSEPIIFAGSMPADEFLKADIQKITDAQTMAIRTDTVLQFFAKPETIEVDIEPAIAFLILTNNKTKTA